MSSARKESWLSTNRVPSGWGCPRRYGTKGCIPLEVKRVVGSFSGTMGAEGMMACPRAAKYSRYRLRTSDTVMHETIARDYAVKKVTKILGYKWLLMVVSVSTPVASCSSDAGMLTCASARYRFKRSWRRAG